MAAKAEQPTVIRYEPRPITYAHGDWSRPLQRTAYDVKFHCRCCKSFVESPVCWVPVGSNLAMNIIQVEHLNYTQHDVEPWCEICVSDLYLSNAT